MTPLSQYTAADLVLMYASMTGDVLTWCVLCIHMCLYVYTLNKWVLLPVFMYLLCITSLTFVTFTFTGHIYKYGHWYVSWRKWHTSNGKNIKFEWRVRTGTVVTKLQRWWFSRAKYYFKSELEVTSAYFGRTLSAKCKLKGGSTRKEFVCSNFLLQ
jgi:hypothetical protein